MFNFVTGTYHLLLVFMIFLQNVFSLCRNDCIDCKKRNGVFVIAFGRIIYGFSFRSVFGTKRRFV